MNTEKIDLNKKYRFKGYPEAIVHIYEQFQGDIFYRISHSAPTCWIPGSISVDKFGCYFEEISPYEDFKIDEPVMVKDHDTSWQERHFAGVDKDGRVRAWVNGYTSWTTISWSTWDECRRPTKEELEGRE